ncbi:MAG: SAM-dependent DNA methyltransferase [Desulfovibrio sp.]|nr:SAM-dependent DNA methyltransferase [Desulfovibrio sp.]
MARPKKEKQPEPLEKQLWSAADKLRKNIDAAEYKHVVLGLIFLKYISESFEALHSVIAKHEGEYEFADPEDIDEYIGKNIFFVPENARWSYLQSKARLPEIGKLIDAAMEAIEERNPSLKNVLPKVYAKENLDPASLGGLIDLIANVALSENASQSADILGHVFEYFLGEFALSEGKKGGQFYTPRSIVELLVAMLEPYKGRVMDPCCGSGGMFVQSEKFVKEHQGMVNDISIYGQESNQTTWRLAKMNLAIRAIESSQIKWNSEGSFLNDALKDVRADFILANPPFNDSDWSGDQLEKDARWQFGRPPASNANFAWLQHFFFHLAPNGYAGIVLAKGALTSKSSGEGEIRRHMIAGFQGEETRKQGTFLENQESAKANVRGNCIDCIVNLPAKLFLNTQIPAALWFLAKNRGETDKYRDRTNEILFIDARNMGELINRRTRILTQDDIKKIADTYHAWRNKDGKYEDVKGFCAAVSLDRVKELDYVLTPGRYVGLPDEEDDFDFKERFEALKAELAAELEEEKKANEAIAEALGKVVYEDK